MNGRQIAFFVGASLLASICLQADAASLRLRGGTVTPDPPTTDTCPLGLAYSSFDGCLDANPEAQFRNANLIATYALDINGNPQTIHHTGPYNKVGIDFPTGQTTTTGKEDPRDFTVVGVATITGGNTLNISSIANGGVPKAEMWMWDRPASGTQHYTPGQAPKIVSCTPNSGGFLYQCGLDRTVSNRSAFNLYASKWYGCVLLIQGGGTNGSSGQSYDQIYCDFRGSAHTATALIRNITFGAVGGHNATILTVTTHNSGTTYGTVDIDNSLLTIDEHTESHAVLSSGVSAANARLRLTNSECDGGLSGDPLLGPYTYPLESICFNWDSPGSTTHGRNQVLVQNVYTHDWAGRPFSTQAGNTDTIFQNVFFSRVNLNCGDIVPPLAGCHGTLIAHGTTIRGSSGSIKVKNLTAVYPYGQRNGVITGAISLQGGIGSFNTMEVEIAGATIIGNTGGAAGHGVMSVVARVGRVGAVSSLKMQHLYVNSHGTASCFNISGDLQTNSAATATLTPNVGHGTSIWNWSGFSGTPTLPYPGQTFVSGLGSQAVKFKGTLTDNGNGTSTLNITDEKPPGTIAAKLQIVALRLADLQAHPTLIVSGSGSTYIVSNGSGSGENRAEQAFTVAQVIMPAGSIDPNTGLPTTATFGPTVASFNGTSLVGGERTVSPASNQYSADAPALGNRGTIDTDVHDLYMMNIAGDAGRIILDGLDLASGQCPGTQAP